ATNLSSTQMTAQSGDAYRLGLTAANPQMMGGIMMVVAAIYFVPMYLRKGFYTIPQFLETRYNRFCKLFYSVVIVFDGFLKAPVGVYAGSLAIVKVFNLDESHLLTVAIIMGTSVGIYSIVGGLMSVVVTDVIQVSILMLGGVLVLVFGLAEIPDLGVFWAEMKETHLEMIQPADSKGFPWTGVASGLALISLVWASSNAGMLQRVLGAKDVREAQVGMIFAGFLKISAVFLIVFPGVIAAYLYPGENPEGVYAVMVREMLPPVLAVIVLAALLAALMSSQDSGVCNVASIVALDLWPLINKNTSEKRALLIGRITATSMLAFGIFASPMMGEVESVYRYVMKIGSFVIFPIGICFLGGRFFKRANQYGAMAVLISGVPWGMTNMLLTSYEPLMGYAPEWMIETNFFLLSFYYAMGYLVLLLVVSLLTKAPKPEQVEFMSTMNKELDEEGEVVKGVWYRKREFWYGLFFATWIGVYWVF
ncbi:MAG: sodium/solute symporter, partial [Verrucomicrobiota bacterium]